MLSKNSSLSQFLVLRGGSGVLRGRGRLRGATLISIVLPPPLPLRPTPLRLAELAVDKVMTAPCETSILYPKHGENVHCFTAITPCAVLEILSPPYREDDGRKYTYYHDYPYSTFYK
ncbi:hypothetical protein HN51_054894 [Arachis hypogaea]